MATVNTWIEIVRLISNLFPNVKIPMYQTRFRELNRESHITPRHGGPYTYSRIYRDGHISIMLVHRTKS